MIYKFNKPYEKLNNRDCNNFDEEINKQIKSFGLFCECYWSVSTINLEFFTDNENTPIGFSIYYDTKYANSKRFCVEISIDEIKQQYNTEKECYNSFISKCNVIKLNYELLKIRLAHLPQVSKQLPGTLEFEYDSVDSYFGLISFEYFGKTFTVDLEQLSSDNFETINIGIDGRDVKLSSFLKSPRKVVRKYKEYEKFLSDVVAQKEEQKKIAHNHYIDEISKITNAFHLQIDEINKKWDEEVF